MQAALYVRKSNDQFDISDESKSVARQIERGREFAAKNGWTVSDEHVFIDDGVSGAEFTARPGYLRLLRAVEPRAPFSILIVSEISRLGRESLETGYAMKRLHQAGVRVFSYLDSREIKDVGRPILGGDDPSA